MSSADADLDSKLLSKAINLLSFKPRFSGEIRSRLVAEIRGESTEETSEAIDRCIERLVADNFLNDESLAVGYCSFLFNTKFKGPKLIRQKLISRGLKSEFVDRIIRENITREDLNRQILQIIQKKTKSVQDLDFNAKSKLIRFLLSRGFSYDSILHSLDGTD